MKMNQLPAYYRFKKTDHDQLVGLRFRYIKKHYAFKRSVVCPVDMIMGARE